jgi:hypothetical protein
VEHRYFKTACSSNLKRTLNLKQISLINTDIRTLMQRKKLKQFIFYSW